MTMMMIFIFSLMAAPSRVIQMNCFSLVSTSSAHNIPVPRCFPTIFSRACLLVIIHELSSILFHSAQKPTTMHSERASEREGVNMK
jgi:hypothetical protein